MRQLIARRLLISIPLVLLVSILTFVLEALAPGDTARTILGDRYTPQNYVLLRHQLGLDQPLWAQYWHWLSGAVHGDLGVSPISGLSVSGQISTRLGVTLSLILGTVALAALAGIGVGVVSAVRGGVLGRIVDVLALAGSALPSFWFGLVLVTVFAVNMRLFPVAGYVPSSTSPAGWVQSLVLPVVTLAVATVAVIARQTRDGIMDALSRSFIHTLRANGASEASIVFRHALRNAAIPVLTVVGLIFIGLLSSTVVVEAVFAMPGLGGLLVQATSQHDLPVVQGLAVTFTLVVVIVNLLVDLAYGWLNPKARVR